MFKSKTKPLFTLFIPIVGVMAGFFAFSFEAKAATMSVSPSSGTFTVGSTFEVSIYLNTQDQAVNAIEASITFPPDKLQLVSPSTGKSVIGVWTAQPSVNNQTGRVDLQGGVPGGINVSSGLVTTLTFRVKSVGDAAIKFSDQSKVLLHDGRGSNVLNDTTSGVYSLVLPPPAGPIVSSETHPEQTVWYKSQNVVLTWALDERVEGYSYELSDDPSGLPDEIIETDKNSVSYRKLDSGVKYFHIKALRGGVWGGTTHFAVKIDSEPPAEFSVKIIPSARTVRKQPIIEFQTTDQDSGISHYEMKVIPLKPVTSGSPLFVETTSPYVLAEMEVGKYDIVARSYDVAGNYRDSIAHLNIVNSAFEFVSEDGLMLPGGVSIPWFWFWPSALLILACLIYFARRYKKWHKLIELKRQEKELPGGLKQQLDELKKYRQKYGIMSFLLLLSVSAGLFFYSPDKAWAADSLSAPTIRIISSEISNQEIFYLGGRVEIPETQVVIYLQNKETQETFSYEVAADREGEWFYRHSGFLPSGQYILWVQARLQGQASAPSPQSQITVRPTAFQFGGSRLSYEFLYLILLLLFGLALAVTLFYLFYHSAQGRSKHKKLAEEIRQAEESIKRGFAVLKRDIDSELEALRKNKGRTSAEEKSKEAQLLKDLSEVEARLEKEIWEIEEQEKLMAD